MELNELQQLITSMESCGMRSLELRRPGENLKLALTFHEAIPAQLGKVTVGDEAANFPLAATGTTVHTEAAGQFMASHPMCDTPLAQVGRTVKKNEIVGLLKIGPIYAPISATAEGFVSQIFAMESTLLGFGARVLEINGIEERHFPKHLERQEAE